MDEILKDIEITSGKVYFIYANLKALEINNRIFEKNLNRCFLENNT
jgi:succinylglutamate desuccinylase